MTLKSKINITILGGTGFVGSHLIHFLSRDTNFNVTVLVHRNMKLCKQYPNVRFVKGDCFSKVSLARAFTKNGIVINLTYFDVKSSLALDNISNMCIKFKSLKLVHVSSAIIDGSSSDNIITEDSFCYPVSPYEITQYRSEIFLKEKLKNKTNLIVLRPTAIFGENCKNLIQNLKFIKNKSIFLNYLKSSIFSERKMNLVSVENVVSALIFLVKSRSIKNETFIISDDDDDLNNYRSIENLFMSKINKKYLISPVYIHPFFLRSLLFFSQKSSTNPYKIYSDSKLAKFGFKKKFVFYSCLDKFIDWALLKGRI